METLKSIENKLKNIALSHNMVGDSVELLIKLLSYTHYESTSSTRVALLEASPNRAINLNSKIEHAMDEMYSIYRGKNAYLTVKVKVTGNVTLNKFDKVYSDRRNTLYYLEAKAPNGDLIEGSYTFTHGLEYELKLVKSDEVVTKSLGVSTDNPFIIESLDSGISENYELKEDLESSLGLSITKDFGTHIDSSLTSQEEDGLIFDLTTTDYGVRFYSPNPEGFNSSLNYLLTYLPYLNEDIETSQLDRLTIKGFEVDHDSINVFKVEETESIENFLYNLKKCSLLQSRVRSNDDVVDEFKSLYSNKILDAIIGDYILEDDNLIINYIPKGSNSPLGVPSLQEISDLEKQSYIDSLLYYVTKNIDFKPMYDHTNAIKYDIDINMYINKEVPLTELTNKIQDYEYKLGGEINYDELLGFVNNLDGVKYATLSIKSDTGSTVSGTVKLPKDKYFILSESFTYSYKL